MVQISVVIPVYNCERYLNDAVFSVLNQSYDAIDIILVDDGSTDHSAALCDELATLHDNISVIHQTNAGVSAARNRGIEYVLCGSTDVPSPKYVAFLDADDMWAKDFFTEDIRALLSKDYSLIGFQSCCCDTEMLRCSYAVHLNDGEYSGGQKTTAEYVGLHFGAMLYSSDLLRSHEIRFDTTLKFSEDVLFNKQCIFLANRVFLKSKTLYYYRNVTTSAVHNRPYGIQYFDPIFHAYLKSDEMLNARSQTNETEATFGRGFVGWYVFDMIEDHYCHFGSIKSVKDYLTYHNDYVQLIYHYGGKRSIDKFQRAASHPYWFKATCLAKGVFIAVGQLIKQMGILTQYFNKMKYPLIITEFESRPSQSEELI